MDADAVDIFVHAQLIKGRKITQKFPRLPANQIFSTENIRRAFPLAYPEMG